MRLYLIALLSLCVFYTHAQDIQLSALEPNLVLSCDDLVEDFIEAYNQGDEIKSYLTPGEANFGGKVWMPIDGFVGFLSQLVPKPVNSYDLKYYTIDDVDMNEDLKEIAIKLSRVFNNYSVLAHGEINGREASIVLNQQGGEMKIYSITIWDIPLMMNNVSEVSPKDTIKRLNIALDIPDSFIKDSVQQNNFISYVKSGETERDETIQIINNPKQAPLNIITYKWAEYVTSPYRRSDFDISYLPNGYIYQYEVIDDNDRVNKGITVGIEHEGQIIFIQYFGFKDAYNSHWQEIDSVLRNIKKL